MKVVTEIIKFTILFTILCIPVQGPAQRNQAIVQQVKDKQVLQKENLIHQPSINLGNFVVNFLSHPLTVTAAYRLHPLCQVTVVHKLMYEAEFCTV